MSRVRLLHWNAKEAKSYLDLLRAAGYEVDYDDEFRPGMVRAWRQSPPDAFVIDLTRLPSHGREIAVALRQSPATRRIPVVFCEGPEEKVSRIRTELPDAVYCDQSNLKSALKRAIAQPPPDPIRPVQMMDRYVSRTAAQKLGIREGSRVALIDPPRDCQKLLGELPEGVEFVDEPGTAAPVTLCFIHHLEDLQLALSSVRNLARTTKLWVLWRKGQTNGVSEPLIRDQAISLGLVDYKICSVNQAWSAMLFAAKDKPRAEARP